MTIQIDPVEYGKLLHAVEALEDKVSAMETDIKTLLELANRGKGGFWVLMAIASFFGALVSFVANHFFKS